jgi:hypothetical protein
LGTKLGSVVLVAGSAAGPYAAAAAAASPVVPVAKPACSLLTHAQVVTLIDASRFNETIHTADHCSWDTPGPEITANGVQLETEKVTLADTLANGPSSAVRGGCGHYLIKHFVQRGVTGYYCIYAQAISGGQMFAQEGEVQIWIPINYGLPGDTVKVPAFISDAVGVVKELNA